MNDPTETAIREASAKAAAELAELRAQLESAERERNHLLHVAGFLRYEFSAIYRIRPTTSEEGLRAWALNTYTASGDVGRELLSTEARNCPQCNPTEEAP